MKDLKRSATKCLALGAALGIGVVPVAVAAAATPKKGAAFVGTSTQKSGNLGLPLDIRVSPTATTMGRFDIEWTSTCQGTGGQGSYGGLSVTLNKKITKGVFTDQSTFSKSFSNGDKGAFVTKLYGKFTSPLRAAGTFRVTVVITDGTSGATVDTCDSGVVTWIATN
ncbi:MAG TPA: hypothetical protein VG165_03585 [Solirubrobacteraceae bacterium]|jgi:hypothetical protein|nr:hypothetical protein [Solirubrobacteraceae bacterium]